MRIDDEIRGQLATRFEVLLPHRNERQQWLALVCEARLLGQGGVHVVQHHPRGGHRGEADERRPGGPEGPAPGRDPRPHGHEIVLRPAARYAFPTVTLEPTPAESVVRPEREDARWG